MGLLERHRRSNFAGKISLLVSVAVLLVFVVVYTFNVVAAIYDVDNKERLSNFANVKLIASKVTTKVREIEQNVNSHEIALRQSYGNDKLVHDVLKDIAKGKHVVASYYSLKPEDKNGDLRGKSFEVVKLYDGSVRETEVNVDVYKYWMYPYFIVPMRLGCDYWSEPYFEGADRIVTYSHPVRDENGAVCGVLSADVLLSSFTDNLRYETELHEKALLMVLSSQGHYLVHNRTDMLVNHTFITNARETNSPDIERVGRMMLVGNDSTEIVYYRGVKQLYSYTQIPYLKWGVSLVLPYQVIYERIFDGVFFSVVLMLIGVLLVAFLIAQIVKRLTRPITYYAEASKIIAKGDFDTPLKVERSRDEIETLGESLNYMRTSLKQYVSEIGEQIAARKSFETELVVAHDIQMSMLPTNLNNNVPLHPWLDVYAFIQSAKEVGGDLYDFFIKDDCFYFVVGDVSGKGIPASLIMSISTSLFRAVGQMYSDPKDIVGAINNAIVRNNERNMFVTMIVGKLDLSVGKLQLCNAGHEPVLLMRHSEFVDVEMETNFPVGIMEGLQYKTNELQLEERDKLILYTDGIVEAENRNKELYSLERLKEILAGLQSLPSKVLIEWVVDSVKSFADNEPQSDDITIMAIEYAPKKGKSKAESV